MSHDMIQSTNDSVFQELTRGVDAIYSAQGLQKKLASGRMLRIKLGMDPTAPDIHLGHCVVLRKMRQFQDHGHKAVLIIGDTTARIGDPTGRDSTRPVLDDKTIQENAKTYLDQAGKILDLSPEKFEVCRNSQWLEKLDLTEILKLTSLVTVQQMLHRENFKLRLRNETEIMVSELLYPLMQGFDSVAIKADVELGGTDQTFNNLMGRELMAKHGLGKQVVMVMPILTGLDGQEKMSKSKGNTIAVTDLPNDIYGKIMSIPDKLMANYFQLLTSLDSQRIDNLLDVDQTHPREAKDLLAKLVVESFYDQQQADQASSEFTRRFSEHQLPSDIQTKVAPSSPIGIIALIRHVGFAKSNSEARRLIEQGGVSFDGNKLRDPNTEIEIGDGEKVLTVGKRRVCKVAVD